LKPATAAVLLAALVAGCGGGGATLKKPSQDTFTLFIPQH
jgi:hypothetical protein